MRIRDWSSDGCSADLLLAGFLAQLGRLDALFQLGQLVAAVLALAELLLDRLELFVQIVLALGLLHLALHAVADALLDLQHADLAFHEGVDLLQAVADRLAFQQLLLLGDLERSEEHTSELQSLMRISYAVFCLKKKTTTTP